MKAKCAMPADTLMGIQDEAHIFAMCDPLNIKEQLNKDDMRRRSWKLKEPWAGIFARFMLQECTKNMTKAWGASTGISMGGGICAKTQDDYPGRRG